MIARSIRARGRPTVTSSISTAVLRSRSVFEARPAMPGTDHPRLVGKAEKHFDAATRCRHLVAECAVQRLAPCGAGSADPMIWSER